MIVSLMNSLPTAEEARQRAIEAQYAIQERDAQQKINRQLRIDKECIERINRAIARGYYETYIGLDVSDELLETLKEKYTVTKKWWLDVYCIDWKAPVVNPLNPPVKKSKWWKW